MAPSSYGAHLVSCNPTLFGIKTGELTPEERAGFSLEALRMAKFHEEKVLQFKVLADGVASEQ